MIRRSALLYLCSIFSVCFAYGQDEIRSRIDVTVSGLGRETVFLANYYGSKLYYTDTTVSDSRGRLSFRKPSGYKPGVYAVVVPGPKYFEIILNESSLKFETSIADLMGAMKVLESNENQIFFDYIKFLTVLKARREVLRTQAGGTNASITEQLAELDQRVKDYQKNIIATYPNTLIAAIVRMSMVVEIPEQTTRPGWTEGTASYYQYRAHFWDHFDLGDERIVRTPVFANKFNEYITKVIPQIPDTIIRLVDELISRVRSKEVFKYMVHTLANRYETTDIMGMDAVFAHMVLEYYCPKSGRPGRATWIDNTQLDRLCSRAREIAYPSASVGTPKTNGSMSESISFTYSKGSVTINRVAVVGLSGKTCRSEPSNDAALVDLAAVPLAQHYVVLERQNLNTVLDEAKFGMTGLVDEASAARVGELLGAEGVIMCKQTCFEGRTLFTVKLVQCSTGAQVWAASASDVSYTELLNEIVRRL